jgi:hypothetical protein
VGVVLVAVRDSFTQKERGAGRERRGDAPVVGGVDRWIHEEAFFAGHGPVLHAARASDHYYPPEYHVFL